MALSALSSIFGLASKGNSLVQTAGLQSRATIQEAGNAAKSVLETMQKAANNTIALAGKEVKDLLVDVDGKIKGNGQQFLDQAAKTSEFILAKTGLAVCKVIDDGAFKLQDSIVLLSEETQKQLTGVQLATQEVINAGAREVRKILLESRSVYESVYEMEKQDRQKIMQQTIDNVTKKLDQLVINVDQVLKTRIDQIQIVGKGLLYDFGEQGRLLIQQTGETYQFTANQILINACKQGNKMIGYLGEEGRITINAAENAVKVTVNTFPYIAAKISEAAGRNFVKGLKDGLFGLNPAENMGNKIKNYFLQSNFSLVEIVDYIKDQTQLVATNKIQLYESLIDEVNDPNYTNVDQKRDKALVYIGVAILEDKGLSEEGYLYSCYHGKQLIEKIFPESARQILLNKNLEEARSFCSVEQICEEIKLFEPDQQQHLLCALEERIGEVQEKERELSKAKEKLSQNEDNVKTVERLKKENQTLLELIDRYKQTLQSYKEAAASSGRY